MKYLYIFIMALSFPAYSHDNAAINAKLKELQKGINELYKQNTYLMDTVRNFDAQIKRQRALNNGTFKRLNQCSACNAPAGHFVHVNYKKNTVTPNSNQVCVEWQDKRCVAVDSRAKVEAERKAREAERIKYGHDGGEGGQQ